LLLTLLAENRFPTIWMPSTEQRDLRTLLRHHHKRVRMVGQSASRPSPKATKWLISVTDTVGQ
jgi:hypothetical protein